MMWLLLPETWFSSAFTNEIMGTNGKSEGAGGFLALKITSA